MARLRCRPDREGYPGIRERQEGVGHAASRCLDHEQVETLIGQLPGDSRGLDGVHDATLSSDELEVERSRELGQPGDGSRELVVLHRVIGRDMDADVADAQRHDETALAGVRGVDATARYPMTARHASATR